MWRALHDRIYSLYLFIISLDVYTYMYIYTYNIKNVYTVCVVASVHVRGRVGVAAGCRAVGEIQGICDGVWVNIIKEPTIPCVLQCCII